MKELKNYTVIRDLQGVNHIVSKSNISRNIYKHDLMDGTRYTAYDADDYSLYNRESAAFDDMAKEGVEKFGEAFKDIKYGDDYRVDGAYDLKYEFIVYNDYELDLEDKVEDIEAFMADWEKANAEYTTVDAYEYWDGSNNRSVVLGFDGEELSEEESKPIISAWINAGEWKEDYVGYYVAYSQGYKLEESQYERDWGIVTAVLDK